MGSSGRKRRSLYPLQAISFNYCPVHCQDERLCTVDDTRSGATVGVFDQGAFGSYHLRRCHLRAQRLLLTSTRDSYGARNQGVVVSSVLKKLRRILASFSVPCRGDGCTPSLITS